MAAPATEGSGGEGAAAPGDLPSWESFFVQVVFLLKRSNFL
jgi:hypothetical protein